MSTWHDVRAFLVCCACVDALAFVALYLVGAL